jgi:hypothetical protein
MLRGYFALELSVGFLGPLPKHCSTELSNFIDHSIFCVMGIATIANRLLKGVYDLVQSFQ